MKQEVKHCEALYIEILSGGVPLKRFLAELKASCVMCTHVSCLTFRSGREKRNGEAEKGIKKKKTPTYATWHSLEGDKVRGSTLANRREGENRERNTERQEIGIESHPHPRLDISSMMFHLIKNCQNIRSSSVERRYWFIKNTCMRNISHFPERRLVKARGNGEEEKWAKSAYKCIR